MAPALVEAFRSEIPCSEPDAALLASLARTQASVLGGTSEDSDEDLILRLRDPRAFGAFVESIAEDGRIGPTLRPLLFEHVFDLLPLPRTEGEVIAVESRAPRRLLAFAAALAASEGLSVLHVMHLVYAMFLDRSLVMEVPRKTRTAVLRAIVSQKAGDEPLRVLYACLGLASVPGPEAASELRWILKERVVPFGVRRALAQIGAAEDGGRAALMRIAQQQGLIPGSLRDPEDPEILANIPRLPERLSASSRRFLKHSSPE